MDTDTKVFRDSSPAPGAELSRVFGRDFNYCSGSLFRFPAQYVKEPKPSHVSHRPVEGFSAVPSTHFLNANCAVVADKLFGELEVEVSPLVVYLLVGFGNNHSCFKSPFRAFNPAGEPLLPHREHILRLFEKAWVVYFCAFRSGQKGFAAHIYAYYLVAGRKWLVRHIVARETGIPFASESSMDSDSLNPTLYRAGEFELELANMSNKQVFPVQFPAVLFKGKTIIPVPTLKAREADLVSISNPSEKPLIGSIKPLKHFLENLRADIGIFGKGYLELGEFFDLVKARYEMTMGMVSGYALLKSRVVEIATQIKPMLCILGRPCIGIDTILKRFLPLHDFIISYQDINKEG